MTDRVSTDVLKILAIIAKVIAPLEAAERAIAQDATSSADVREKIVSISADVAGAIKNVIAEL